MRLEIILTDDSQDPPAVCRAWFDLPQESLLLPSKEFGRLWLEPGWIAIKALRARKQNKGIAA